MLHITIKDLKTDEVIYDNQVSMVIMQASENGCMVRKIRHTTEDAVMEDVLGCVDAAVKEAAEAKSIMLHALGSAIMEVDDE